MSWAWDGPGRTIELGSVSIAVGDYNNDGRLDLFYANYGPSWLMRNDGPGKFTDVAPGDGGGGGPATGVGRMGGTMTTTASWICIRMGIFLDIRISGITCFTTRAIALAM